MTQLRHTHSDIFIRGIAHMKFDKIKNLGYVVDSDLSKILLYFFILVNIRTKVSWLLTYQKISESQKSIKKGFACTSHKMTYVKIGSTYMSDNRIENNDTKYYYFLN